MANCLLLLNDGSSNLLLNDGSSKLLLNDDSCDVVSEGGGGGSKVGKSKQVGVSIYDVDQSIPPKKHLFPEWSFEIRATLIQEIRTEFESVARFKLQQKTKRFKVGAETFMIKEKVLEALARFRTPQYHEIYLKARFKIPQIISEWESKWNYDKIINLLEKYTQIIDTDPNEFSFIEDSNEWNVLSEAIPSQKVQKIWTELTIPQREKLLIKMKLDKILATDSYLELPPNIREIFEKQSEENLKTLLGVAIAGTALIIAINILNSPADTSMDVIRDMPEPDVLPKPIGHTPPNLSITVSSSFIGQVTYNPGFQTMDMDLNAHGSKVRVYAWCNVPQRIFDAFKGAPSKGAYFNRHIKGQFDC